MSPRTRSREILVIGGVAATVTKPAPNVTRVEVHADTPEDADRFAAGLADMLKDKQPIASPTLVPESSTPVPNVEQRTEWRLGSEIADPDAIDSLGRAPAVSDAAKHGDSDRADPDTD